MAYKGPSGRVCDTPSSCNQGPHKKRLRKQTRLLTETNAEVEQTGVFENENVQRKASRGSTETKNRLKRGNRSKGTKID